MSVKFIKGAVEVEIKGYNFPYDDDTDHGQVITRSQAGQYRITQKGTSENTRTLFWELMPDSEMTALKTFLTSTIRGARDTFTFEDVDEVQQTARCLNPNARFTSGTEGRWSISLILNFP